MRFKEIHFLACGFTQNRRRVSGMDRLMKRLLPRICSRPAWPTYVMPPMRWTFDPVGNAEWIQRNLDDTGEYRVYTYAYSWGSPTVIRLLEELDKRDITVERACFADPVKRRAVQQRIYHYTGIGPAPKFVIPANVNEVFYTRQSRTWPSGSDMVAAFPRDPMTGQGTLVRGVVFDNDAVDHTLMDDDERFIDEATRFDPYA